MRRKSKIVRIGKVKIGNGFGIAIQGMIKTPASDIKRSIEQIRTLHKNGADIVRLAIDSLEAAESFRNIRKKVPDIPLVADIHFDYRLAIKALEYGADKIRLNPGNIFKPQQVKEVVKVAKKLKKPIRVGLNSGSVIKNKSIDNVQAMVKQALLYIRRLENLDFQDIVISLKSSDLQETIEANRIIARKTRYPIHLGVTATGLDKEAVIKSALGIGVLLLEGIGDTLRVSLTASPFEEVEVAKCILQALNLKSYAYELIACPTCGRCNVDLVNISHEVQKILQREELLSYNSRTKLPVKIAIMGCVVNGPGEAREADCGVAFSKSRAAIFRKGKIAAVVPNREAIKKLFRILKEEKNV